MDQFKKMLPAALALILTAAMVAASEFFHDKEIIFPEITAIAIGALAAPKQSWNASRLRLLLTMTAAAAAGVGMVFIQLPYVLKVPLAVMCAVMFVTVSKTEFLPAISACVLPVLLGTKSPVYIGSVVIMTSLILLAQIILERCGIREKTVYTPVTPDKQLLMLRIKQTIAVSIICIIPTMTREIFFIAPPLIVTFFEMSKPKSKLLEHISQMIMLIALGAVSGVLSRFLLTEKLGVPLAISAVISCAIMLMAVCSMKLYFPPCGAIATLPFIIPEGAMMRFPIEIMAGTLIFVCVVVAVSKEQRIALRVKEILGPQN